MQILNEALQLGANLLHRTELGIVVNYRKSTKIDYIYTPDRQVILES